MQAKSFLGSLQGSARRFYATTIRGEKSDATIQGYVRAASQIEDIWQKIDDKIAAAITQGVPPWQAYAYMGYALACIRAARVYQVFVRELVDADAAYDPSTAGYLPRVTYEQADALCQHIQPCLHHAVAALTDASYIPDTPLPLTLGPRIEAEGEPCPTAHLQGMIAAAQEARIWAAGLLSQYSLAVNNASQPVPPEIIAHIATMQGRLAQGDFKLRFGCDLVGQVSQGQATYELHEVADTSLWDALDQFFLLNQVVAMPRLLQKQQVTKQPLISSRVPKTYWEQPVMIDDLWKLASPSARNELQFTPFGRQEMAELWEKMGRKLSIVAQRYHDEAAAALAQNAIYQSAAMATCPYEPLYRARRNLTITGVPVAAGNEFHWNYHTNSLEQKKRFNRSANWQECEEND